MPNPYIITLKMLRAGKIGYSFLITIQNQLKFWSENRDVK